MAGNRKELWHYQMLVEAPLSKRTEAVSQEDYHSLVKHKVKCSESLFWEELFKKNAAYVQDIIFMCRTLYRYTTNFWGICFSVSTTARKGSKSSGAIFIHSSANKVSLCFISSDYFHSNYKTRASQMHLQRNPWMISQEENSQNETSSTHIFIKSHFRESD